MSSTTEETKEVGTTAPVNPNRDNRDNREPTGQSTGRVPEQLTPQQVMSLDRRDGNVGDRSNLGNTNISTIVLPNEDRLKSDGSNYVVWSMMMEDILEEAGLIDTIHELFNILG